MGDEARSDVALAIATLLLGPLLLSGLRGGAGAAGIARDVAVVLALTALVPLLLIRSRSAATHAGSFASALALDGPTRQLGAGVALALPVALAGAYAMLTAGRTPDAAVLGMLSAGPTEALPIAALSLGSFVFVVFVVRRSAEASLRSPQWPLRRLLRTLGMGSAGVALVAGLLRVPLGGDPRRIVANAAALAVTVLVADRLLGRRRTAPRLALFLPAGLMLYVHVVSFGLGTGLQAGALAAGTITVIGTLALSDDGAWAAVPLVVATHLWPTCHTPLALVGGPC